MTLGAALTAYAELVGDVLVNDCGEEVPGRVLRYHGHAVPDDIDCSKNGILSVWWEPSIVPLNLGKPCSGFPVVTLSARWVVCWKVADVKPGSISLHDAIWDADAGRLADVAECVARALMGLSCGTPQSDHARALLVLLRGDPKATFVGASPVAPLGGVAGLKWQIKVGLGSDITS